MKTSALILAAALALTSSAITTTAEAGRFGGRGFHVFHGPVFSHRFNSHSDDYHARKKARAAAIAAAKKRALAEKLAEKRRRIAAAKAAEAKRAAVAARIEAKEKLAAKRRIAARLAADRSRAAQEHDVAEIDPPAPEQKPDEIAAAADATTKVAAAQTCKRYIPSAEMTITVPCE